MGQKGKGRGIFCGSSTLMKTALLSGRQHVVLFVKLGSVPTFSQFTRSTSLSPILPGQLFAAFHAKCFEAVKLSRRCDWLLSKPNLVQGWV
jgi:hypothetical protein